MKHRESFNTAPITRCALSWRGWSWRGWSWRGWIWRALDTVLDFLLLAAAGIMIGYALANFCYS